MKARVLELAPEKLALALAGVLIVLGAAAWLVLVSPNHSKAGKLSDSIKAEQSTLQKLSGQTAQSHRSAAQKHAVSQALMTARALPNVTAMPQIVLQLSRIADEEHVSLDAVTPQTTIPYSGYTAIPITIQLSGEFFGVQNFLQQLLRQVSTSTDGVKATGRLYDVLSVTIASSSTPPKVTATVVLDAFSYSPVVTPPPGTTTGTTTTSTLG